MMKKLLSLQALMMKMKWWANKILFLLNSYTSFSHCCIVYQGFERDVSYVYVCLLIPYLHRWIYIHLVLSLRAALSLFFETSCISESGFSSLLEILSPDSFKKEDIPPNVSVFKLGKAKLGTMVL